MKTFKYLAVVAIAALAFVSWKEGPTKRIEFEAFETYPEGVIFDKGSNAYYVSSARLGNIGKVTPQGVYSVLHPDSNLKSTYGIKVHPDGKRLFVCAGDANYSKFTSPKTRMTMARLIILDLGSGKKLNDIDLAGLLPGKHFPNDIAFDKEHNAYITDSYAGAIYKVSADGKASVFAKDEQFKTEGVGLNGIVYHPGGFLIVDNSAKGQLFKIAINNPKNVARVNIDQYFMGADGLVLNDDNTLTMVVNGGTDKIFQLSSKDNWQSAKVSASTSATDRFTYPSTATLVEKDIWVMNAQFSQLLDSNSVPVKKFAIQQAVLKPVTP